MKGTTKCKIVEKTKAKQNKRKSQKQLRREEKGKVRLIKNKSNVKQTEKQNKTNHLNIMQANKR